MSQNIILAFGGNVPSEFGTSAEIISKAIGDLTDAGLDVVAISNYHNTPSFPSLIGPDYVNVVVSCCTKLTAHAVLQKIHEIEDKYGRAREARWGSRTLDIDLIAFDDLVCPDLETYKEWRDLLPSDQSAKAPNQLVLPHPRLQDRAFVLVPMSDIAPDWRHPVSGLSTVEMLAQLPDDDVASVVAVSAP